MTLVLVLVAAALVVAALAPIVASLASPSRPSAPLVPAVEATALASPATEVPTIIQVPPLVEPAQTAVPVPIPSAALPATPAPASTAPRASVPPGPATTAAPGTDVHSIAPEPGLPANSPPPGRE
jgi:hypothetical protein